MKLQAAKKGSSIVLLALLAASILLVFLPSASASSPSVPEIVSMEYIDSSYDVPTVYQTDQFTGQSIIKTNGYHVDNRSIVFTIKNQLFTSYTDSSGNQTRLYFNFRTMGSYGTQWSYHPFGSGGGQSTHRYGGLYDLSTDSPADLAQSSGKYTILTIPFPTMYNIPVGSQLEIQIQALVGYMLPYDGGLGGCYYNFYGQSSDWSSTQTITIGETAPAVTQTPTSAPTQPPTIAPTNIDNSTISGTKQNFTVEFDWQTVVIVVLGVVVVVLALIVVLQRKNRIHLKEVS